MLKVRVSIFIALGISAICPFIYLGQQKSMENLSSHDLTPFLTGGAAYIIGGAIQATRVTEYLFPGKVNFFGTAHQLFHIFVLIGAAIHY